MNFYHDLNVGDDQESWRRSKRVADNNEVTMNKGLSNASSGAGKRNRSALANISNGSEGTSGASLVNKPVTRLSSATSALTTHAASAQDGVGQAHGRFAGSSSSRREKIMLSPCTSDAINSLSDMLSNKDDMDTDDYVASSQGSASSQAPAAPARILFAQDCLNASNTQFCVEYAHEIFDHLLKTEQDMMPASDYMDQTQHDINPTMRGILIDWLVEVAEEYKLHAENLYLSTNYVDRFLTIKPVLRGQLQLVGVACMLVASKYEEIFAPQVEDFVYITDNTYKATEVLHMESVILNALRFNLTAVTPHTFLCRILSLLACGEQVKNLSTYLSEITIQEFHFLKYKPSIIAISAVILALYTIDQEPLPDTLRLILKVWNRTMDEITPCVRDLHLVHYKIFDKTRSMQASYEKYSHQKWSRVSLLAPKLAPPF